MPVTDWSHHLQADEALPTSRWVHLVGTYDGQTMKIYVDGQLQGTMDRPGRVHANKFHVCLGTYEVDHVAHFDGLLDEVKLYSRALNADEVRAQYRLIASRLPDSLGRN